MSNILAKLNWPIIFALCLTLGLAPFKPAPHVWEKLNMLVDGALSAPADIFDLCLHGAPWVLLSLKIIVHVLGRKT